MSRFGLEKIRHSVQYSRIANVSRTLAKKEYRPTFDAIGIPTIV